MKGFRVLQKNKDRWYVLGAYDTFRGACDHVDKLMDNKRQRNEEICVRIQKLSTPHSIIKDPSR